jgi:hypothetical protein
MTPSSADAFRTPFRDANDKTYDTFADRTTTSGARKNITNMD